MSNVWDRTAEFLSDNLRALAAVAALALFLPTAVETLVRQAAVDAGAGGKLGASLVVLILSLVGVYGQLAITMLALDPPLGARGAFRAAAPRFPILIGVSVVLLAVLLVALLPLIGLLAADGTMTAETLETGTMATTWSPSGVTVAAIVLYVLVGLPLLVWVCARLSVVSAVVAAERRGLGALGEAFRLTRGHAGRILGTLLLILVVGGVAALAVQLVVGSVLRLAIERSDGFDWALAATAIVVALVTTALTVVLNAFVAKLYLALVARRAARDGVVATR